jgi:hypothetical protein
MPIAARHWRNGVWRNVLVRREFTRPIESVRPEPRIRIRKDKTTFETSRPCLAYILQPILFVVRTFSLLRTHRRIPDLLRIIYRLTSTNTRNWDILTMKAKNMFLSETWTLFGIGTFWILLRFIVRIRTVGISGLQGDDGFAFSALICWIIIASGIHITSFTGTAVGYAPHEVDDLSPAKLADAVYGSKVYFLTWYA